MEPYVIQLVGLATGDATRFDGKYVVAYYPERWRWREISSLAELEELLAEFVEVTDDPAAALTFESSADAMAFWRQEGVGVRPWDGQRNRPLTAFHVSLVRR